MKATRPASPYIGLSACLGPAPWTVEMQVGHAGRACTCHVGCVAAAAVDADERVCTGGEGNAQRRRPSGIRPLVRVRELNISPGPIEET